MKATGGQRVRKKSYTGRTKITRKGLENLYEIPYARFTASMPQELYNSIKAIAALEQISLTEMICRCIRTYLGRPSINEFNFLDKKPLGSRNEQR
jgi:hypothetical protein